MPPEETSTPDQSPVVEVPAPSVEPDTPPEVSSAPAETAPTPDATSAPQAETAQPSTSTAQIPPNEPLPPEPEPFDSAQDKPTATPEPPSAAASTPAPAHPIRDFLNKARIATQDRKRKKRDRIMLALNTKNKITNDEVEKLLHVSDATATRYLSALEKENKIKQVGKTGTGVVYSKI